MHAAYILTGSVPCNASGCAGSYGGGHPYAFWSGSFISTGNYYAVWVNSGALGIGSRTDKEAYSVRCISLYAASCVNGLGF